MTGEIFSVKNLLGLIYLKQWLFYSYWKKFPKGVSGMIQCRVPRIYVAMLAVFLLLLIKSFLHHLTNTQGSSVHSLPTFSSTFFYYDIVDVPKKYSLKLLQ